ncbi:MAG TPA: fatty acid desaturase [Pseudonocardia sp.]|jgi:ferredoxin-NADP reductase
MSVTADPSTSPSSPSRHALPDPGERVPRLAWPTVGIFTASLVLFVAGTWAALAHALPVPVTMAMNTIACFVMFTVVHDASHYSISSTRWVNNAFGRAAWLFVSSATAFKVFGFIHIEHHRNANDDEHDPDTYASHGPWWQLPIRWATLDLSYLPFYLRNLRRRPRGEVIETAILFTATIAVIITTILTGTFWMLAVIYLIPERIAIFMLGWWFDWLPHHGLAETQRENRYRATRNRVGMEWLYTPLLLSQNYHLVHHLHPSIPFYRYLPAWRRNEEAYLEREAAISTVFGHQLDPQQYREWKKLNAKLGRLLPIRMPKSSSAPHAVFHKVPVRQVRRLTANSVEITFDVPGPLRDEFAFQPGQHLSVRTNLGGRDVRRNYSICSSATSGELRIGVKRIPGGEFSSFAAEVLRPGHTLELMTPTGNFGTPVDPLQAKHYVAITAGSGITPVLSMTTTALEVEPESRVTLIYGNQTAESTMFRAELDELESRYADRLEILHVLSQDPRHVPELRGTIDREKLEHWLATTLNPAGVDEWFLCGPIGLTTTARDVLTEHGVNPDNIHFELFFGYAKPAVPATTYPAARLTYQLSGTEHGTDLRAGETILEAALQRTPDAPYACMGGACGTCKAKLLLGTAEMDQNFALGKAELDAGYILTCQAHPTSPTVTVDYDG